MSDSVASKLTDLRQWLFDNRAPMQLAFVDIEDEFLTMHRRILELEEENQRLLHILSAR